MCHPSNTRKCCQIRLISELRYSENIYFLLNPIYVYIPSFFFFFKKKSPLLSTAAEVSVCSPCFTRWTLVSEAKAISVWHNWRKSKFRKLIQGDGRAYVRGFRFSTGLAAGKFMGIGAPSFNVYSKPVQFRLASVQQQG